MKPRVDVGSSVEQSFYARHVIRRHGDDGAEERRGQSMLVERVRVGALTQQTLDPWKVAGTAGQVEAGSTVRVSLSRNILSETFWPFDFMFKLLHLLIKVTFDEITIYSITLTSHSHLLKPFHIREKWH